MLTTVLIVFQILIPGSDSLQLFVRKILNIDHLVVSSSNRPNDLVKLKVNGLGVAVLGVLNQKNDQEGDDGGDG